MAITLYPAAAVTATAVAANDLFFGQGIRPHGLSPTQSVADLISFGQLIGE
jgi:hypothetical protein